MTTTFLKTWAEELHYCISKKKSSLVIVRRKTKFRWQISSLCVNSSRHWYLVEVENAIKRRAMSIKNVLATVFVVEPVSLLRLPKQGVRKFLECSFVRFE